MARTQPPHQTRKSAARLNPLHHVPPATLQALTLTSLALLEKAVEHIEGAKFEIHFAEVSAEQRQKMGIGPDTRVFSYAIIRLGDHLHDTIFARSTVGSPGVPVDENDVVTEGHIQLTYDSDYKSAVERIIGTNGEKLLALYNRESVLKQLQAQDNGQATYSEEWENGMPVLMQNLGDN